MLIRYYLYLDYDQEAVMCYRCGQEGHFTRGCIHTQPRKKSSALGKYIVFLGQDAFPSRKLTSRHYYKVPVTFLLHTGSALISLSKIHPGDLLELWNLQNLVGNEGTKLRVYGSACVYNGKSVIRYFCTHLLLLTL